MKSWLITLALAATKILVALWTSIGQSATFETKNVSADAVWVTHVDVDAARSSKVVEKVFRECLKGCDCVRQGRMKARSNLGIEKIDDLHGITAYGWNFRPQRGVLIVHAKVNAEIAQAKVEKARDHEMIKYEDHKIHTFEVRHGRREREVAVSLHKPDMLVFASSVDLLKSALDVLDGKAKNLAEANNPLAEKPPEGAILLARAININKAPRIKECPVLNQVERFDYAKGQQGDKWFGRMAVTAASNTAADNMKEMAEGFRSMASLYFHDKEPFTAMLSNIKITTEGNAVKLAFEESADKVAEQAPVICKMIYKHIEKHMRWHRERDRFWKRHYGIERYERRFGDRHDRERDRDDD